MYEFRLPSPLNLSITPVFILMNRGKKIPSRGEPSSRQMRVRKGGVGRRWIVCITSNPVRVRHSSLFRPPVPPPLGSNVCSMSKQFNFVVVFALHTRYCCGCLLMLLLLLVETFASLPPTLWKHFWFAFEGDKPDRSFWYWKLVRRGMFRNDLMLSMS